MTTALVPMDSRTAALVEERKTRNRMVQAIRGTMWGKELDQAAQLAVAEYAYRFGLDPVTEVEILGGRIYRNANYYERKIGELAQAGVVVRVERDHVAHDPRLDTLAEMAAKVGRSDDAAEAQAETLRRLRERIRHGIPDKAAGACVVRLHVVGMSEPIVGANWCGNGTRQRDPVGEAEPVKTAETRALRRAAKQLVTSETLVRQHRALAVFAESERLASEEGEPVETLIEAAHATMDAQRGEHRPLAAGRGNDGYRMLARGDYEEASPPDVVTGMAQPAAVAEAIGRRHEATRRTVQVEPPSAAAVARLDEPDPYEGEPGDQDPAGDLHALAAQAETPRRTRNAVAEGR